MIGLVAAALFAQAQPTVDQGIAEGVAARACMVRAFAGADLAAIREAARNASASQDSGQVRLIAALDACGAPLGDARAQMLRPYFAAELDRRAVFAFLRRRLGDAAASRFERARLDYGYLGDTANAHRRELEQSLREFDIPSEYVVEVIALIDAQRRSSDAKAAIDEARSPDRALVVATMESSVELRANITERPWPNYYLLAQALFVEGARDEATRWYFIGQLRGRTAIRCRPPPPGGDGALLGALDYSAREDIIAGHAAADPAAMVAAMTQALVWDAANADPFNSPRDCAAARGEARRAIEQAITYATEHPDEFRALDARTQALME